ncbi:hypothetical protein J7J00_08340 [Bacillus sp. ISL-4]|uniref:hypothetical protein n=1 Tax=Bacillus sp. ISL-4 TaxID=2819125 RepID=UPI001BE83912|nr:hypothetical protein [Bacillus sp. ISL-4]MBT2665504.1 hypothetical protein [Bacillus sp. ISL-4]
MDEMRKKIIIQEINSWKESRMLLEQYCNYLLALYCQGELPPSKSNKTESKKKRPLFRGVAWGSFCIYCIFELFY